MEAENARERKAPEPVEGGNVGEAWSVSGGCCDGSCGYDPMVSRE